MAAVETALRQARAAGRPSLVTYVTGGIREDWTDLLAAMIEAGADAVEIGLPFSDPMLDGRTIQQASAAAISRGASTTGILGQLSAAAAGDVPLIAMTYANHAYSRGLPRFCRQLADAGLSGVIIPDLPAVEAGDYLEAAGQAGLDATLMVAPATGQEQIKAIAGRTRGFLYVMSVMATTGNPHESADTDRWAVAARARRHSPRPVLIGFGIDTPGRADRPAHRARPGPPVSTARRTADDRQPKYLRIHGALRDRITSGRWPAGSPLPSQRELAGEFSVSIMTLRQALQLLADDGLIDTRHGSGTYVASRYAYGLGHLRSFAADLAAQGAQITTRLLAADTVAAPDDVGARLGAAGQVLRLRRLRLANGRPVIVQTSYLPAQLAAALDPADLCRRGLYTVLAEHGRAIGRTSETITPAALSARDAHDLDRPEASPALLSHQVSFTTADLPVVDDHALLAGDSVAITANRAADHLDVHYTLATAM